MPDINWPQVSASLLGGGAAGSLITTLVTGYKSRKQPVGIRKEILPVFRPASSTNQFGAEILVQADSHHQTFITFKNLFLAEISLINSGNKDMDEFNFGVTLGPNDRCIFVETTSQDRHHAASHLTPVSPANPSQILDFALKPFNRKDRYTFKLYLVIPPDQEGPKEINLSSPSPVIFVDMPSIGEILSEAASSVILKFGPLSIGIQR